MLKMGLEIMLVVGLGGGYNKDKVGLGGRSKSYKKSYISHITQSKMHWPSQDRLLQSGASLTLSLASLWLF